MIIIRYVVICSTEPYAPPLNPCSLTRNTVNTAYNYFEPLSYKPENERFAERGQWSADRATRTTRRTVRTCNRAMTILVVPLRTAMVLTVVAGDRATGRSMAARRRSLCAEDAARLPAFASVARAKPNETKT